MNNTVFEDAQTLSLVCDEPAAPNAGDPVRFGNLTGVAVDDENAAGVTVVQVGTFVSDLSVTDHVAGGGGILVGDSLFYVSATDAIENDSAGYFFGFALEIVGNGLTATIQVLHVPSPGASTLGAGTIGAANLATGAVVAGKVAAGGVSASNQVADGILTGGKVAESADEDPLGAVPLLYHQTIPDVGAPTNYDIAVTSKVRVAAAWIVNTGAAAHAADDHVQVCNGADPITEEIVKTAAVNLKVDATTFDEAHVDIADGGTLRFTATKATNIACEAYVLAYRIA